MPLCNHRNLLNDIQSKEKNLTLFSTHKLFSLICAFLKYVCWNFKKIKVGERSRRSFDKILSSFTWNYAKINMWNTVFLFYLKICNRGIAMLFFFFVWEGLRQNWIFSKLHADGSHYRNVCWPHQWRSGSSQNWKTVGARFKPHSPLPT